MNELLLGIKYTFSSFGYIHRHRLGYVYLISLCLIVLYTIANMKISGYVSDYIEMLVDAWLNSMSLPEWLNGTISTTAMVITSVICFIAIATLGGSIIMILLSPLFSHIAEKVTSNITGNTYPFKTKVFLYQIWRGIRISLRNIVLQYAIIIVLFIFSFVPALGWFCNIAIFFVNAFFYGFTLMDYAFEVKMMTIKRSAEFANANKLLLIGLGLSFSMCMFLPIVGMYLAAFIVPATVVAGVRLLNERNTEIEQN